MELKKRIIIITGHYGSGKTNLAVNLAMDLQRSGKKVCLVDLDIVNPYFRAADLTQKLTDRGVRVIAPLYARSNLDIPALPGEMYAVFDDRSYTVVLDVGGDDAGAAALGRFASKILAENDYEHLYVLNARRALTRTAQEAADILRDIEQAGRVPVTALVNNTNLAGETDGGVVEQSLGFVREAAELTGLPVKFHCVKRDVSASVHPNGEPVYPVDIWVNPPW